MAVFSSSIVTNRGQNLILKIGSNGTGNYLTFTNIRTSSRAYPTSTDFLNMTVLDDIKQTIAVTEVKPYPIVSDAHVKVSSLLTNSGITSSYNINTVGLYATDPDIGEILFAIVTATTSDLFPDQSTPTSINLKFIVRLTSTMNITLISDKTQAATVDQLDTALQTVQTDINNLVNRVTIIERDYVMTVDLPDFTNMISQHNLSSVAHPDIRTLVTNATNLANQAMSIAQGRAKAVTYPNYQQAIANLNTRPQDYLKIGDAILILAQNVPDLWVYQISSSRVNYTYTTDGDFLEDFNQNQSVQVGYFVLGESDSEKVDLTGYVPLTRTINGVSLQTDMWLPFPEGQKIWQDGGTDLYRTLTIPGITSYSQLDGVAIRVNTNISSTGSPISMNINGLGNMTLAFPTTINGTTTLRPHQRWCEGGYTITYMNYSLVVIDFNITTASTSIAGIVQLTDSVTSTSITTAATPNSVRLAYNKANEAQTLANNITNNVVPILERNEESLSRLEIYGNRLIQVFSLPYIDLSDFSLKRGNIFKLNSTLTSLTNISFTNVELMDPVRHKSFELHIPIGDVVPFIRWPGDYSKVSSSDQSLSGTVTCCSITANGEFAAIGTNGSFLNILQKAADDSSLWVQASITGSYKSCSFDDEGHFLLLVKQDMVELYTRTGGTFNQTRVLSQGGFSFGSISGDGSKCVIVRSNLIDLYNISSDGSMSLSVSLDTGMNLNCIEISRSGKFFAFGSTSGKISIYTYDTITEIYSNTITGGVNNLAFSTDESLLGVVTSTSPYIHIYKRVGDSFGKLDNLPSVGASASDISFSLNNSIIAVPNANSTASIVFYYFQNGSYAKLPYFSAIPVSLNGINGRAEFSRDGEYLCAAGYQYANMNKVNGIDWVDGKPLLLPNKTNALNFVALDENKFIGELSYTY